MGALRAAIRAAAAGDGGALERIERSLAGFHGVRRALLTDSGTSALIVAMQSAMAHTGRAGIALPAYCCYDLVTAVNGARAGVVFYDVDPVTLGPDWPSFEAALESRPAAVVVAHLYGVPVDMVRVMELAEAVRVPVIEDAAQGSGASLHGQPLGTFGDLRVLSFGRGKGVTAGRGGALLVAPGWRGPVPEELSAGRGAAELPKLVAQWALARPGLYRVPASLPFLGLGETLYREPAAPAGLSAVGAAVLEWTWSRREREVAARRSVAARLNAGLPRNGSLRVVVPVRGGQPGWLRLPVLAAAAADRLRAGHLRRLGVMPGYPVPLSQLPQCPASSTAATPGARQLAETLFTLPTHSQVGDREIRGILAALTG